MAFVAHHGFDVAHIILRVFAALQAIPNHCVDLFKGVGFVHFFLRQYLHSALAQARQMSQLIGAANWGQININFDN